jgi:hypothetical protein
MVSVTTTLDAGGERFTGKTRTLWIGITINAARSRIARMIQATLDSSPKHPFEERMPRMSFFSTVPLTAWFVATWTPLSSVEGTELVVCYSKKCQNIEWDRYDVADQSPRSRELKRC